MYVCICNAVTDKQIRSAAEAGADDLWKLQAQLGVATQCGSCKEQASSIIRATKQNRDIAQPAVYRQSSA